jgi:hypothetical protein
MSAVVVVLWLGTAASRPSAEPDLDSWARARLVRIEDASTAPRVAAEYDDALVRKIEELLEQARVATDAMNEQAALGRLAEVSKLIGDHPELPQAAWLSAERMMLEAALYDRRPDTQVSERRPSAGLPDNTEKARALRRAARALEGQRVAPLAETAQHAAPETGADAPAARVRIGGLEPGDRLFWDGRLVGRTVVASTESHHARVVRQGRSVWAAWISSGSGAKLELGAPVPDACSLDDLGSARIEDHSVIAPAGARCRAWAVARPEPGGGIEIARCSKNRCGPLLPWHERDGGAFAGQPQPAPERHTPAWLFVAAGIGAAALSGVLVWQSGVFDEPDPAQDRVIWRGPASR